MKYFLFNTLGDTSNDDYCFTSDTPEGGIDSWGLIAGYRIADEYPNGIEKTILRLEEEYPGLVLASYIGNADRMLAFRKDVAKVIVDTNQSETEVIPFTLLDHKGKIRSEDYVFINPVGAIDCVNWKESVCTRDNEGNIETYEKLVFSKEKLEQRPHLFRIKFDTSLYLFSEALANTLLSKGYTNLIFKDIEVA
ncbi:hypothetical protein HCH_04290 [Hahella chejuensis KCTC 2396]|uniref:Immunity MXAN-0049 protein domain-containing protein n=1 Tax=Hahella chejuensis (strain KCTC 2396) TaxID=349521 RepID=Q2SEC7_HAHCH|nr:DUF1629 domain-containing protein [Hahella chejuensis]ABC30997.1 hypothetical protein HCH_04290 [Hahella chejuensis KCTC 2396]